MTSVFSYISCNVHKERNIQEQLKIAKLTLFPTGRLE